MVSHKKEDNYDKMYSNIVENEDDIEKIIKKIKKYDIKRKEYENNVYNYYKERRERERYQSNLGQAINILPLFSNAYNYSTSSINQKIDDKEMDTLDILKKSIDEEYEELLCLCNKLKKLNQNAS